MRLAAGIAALLSVLCFATGAFAHATLVATEPADGSVVAQAPKMVHLRFNEGVTPASSALIDADGKTRDDITSHVAGPSVFVALPENLPRGTQIVSYRVVSQDGHPVAGSLMFSVGAVTRGQCGQASGGPSRIDIWLARIGVYLGLFVGVGGVFFAAWIGCSPDGRNDHQARARPWPRQRGGIAWPARPRSAKSSARCARNACTMEGCVLHQFRTVDADRDGGDGDCGFCLAQPEQHNRLDA